MFLNIADNEGPEVSDIFLNGQTVNLADVRDKNCDPIVNFYNVSGETDLSATITDVEGDVVNAKYKVRKVASNGCSLTSVFSSGFVNMTNTSGDTWEDLVGFNTQTAPDGEYTVQLQTTDSNSNTATRYIDIVIDNHADEKGECKLLWSNGLEVGAGEDYEVLAFRNQGDCVSYFATMNSAVGNNPATAGATDERANSSRKNNR